MRPVLLTDRARIPSRTRKETRARLGHNHSKVFSPQRLPSNGSEGLRGLRTMPAPLAIFPKKGQAFSHESVVRSRFRAFLPHFCVDLRGFSAITEPSDRPRHLCDPAERPKNLQAATNLRPETTFRNSAIHLTRIKFSQKKEPCGGSNVRPAGLQRLPWAQQIRGSCSPASQSTVRRPPMRVTISTMPTGTSESSVTRPILAAFSP